MPAFLVDLASGVLSSTATALFPAKRITMSPGFSGVAATDDATDAGTTEPTGFCHTTPKL